MTMLNFKDFMGRYILKDFSINESELQRVYKYSIYPDKGFVNIDDGRISGTHWTCFLVKDNKSYYSDSFGGQLVKGLLNQLPKPIVYPNYKIQDINYNICGSFCFYFFCLIERMNYYDTILKM